MYVTLEEAREEVWKRWNNFELRQNVLEYVGEVPAVLRSEPRAILARFIATPNFEFSQFAEGAKRIALQPLTGEYTRDKFCSVNIDKRNLGKITFHRGDMHYPYKNKTKHTACYNIIDFSSDDGKPFANLKTIWAQSFIEFHHHLVSIQYPNVEVFDFSTWLQKNGGSPTEFYQRFLALFICYGVLFENFHTEGGEADFNRKVVWPAFQKIKTHFNLKPLIVPVVPVEREREPFWSWYPEILEEFVTHRLSQWKVVP